MSHRDAAFRSASDGIGARRLGSAFTLVELLVVIAIIAILAALLFPVFNSAKMAAKKTTCLSNLREVGMAAEMYLTDSDDEYPQARQYSSNPAEEDASGEIDEPIYEPALQPYDPYIERLPHGHQAIEACPADPDPFGSACAAVDPDAPDVTSYVTNAYFVFGLSLSGVTQPASTIQWGERRSTDGGESPYCDDIYHPWFTSQNSDAPEVDMTDVGGAISALRHSGLSNYEFVDGHAKTMTWGATYSPPKINLHLVVQ